VELEEHATGAFTKHEPPVLVLDSSELQLRIAGAASELGTRMAKNERKDSGRIG
jgi:hypothetical protein